MVASEITRKTAETEIQASLLLNAQGKSRISTGIGFLDHMLRTLSFHAGFDLELTCKGDLDIDDHHSVEDCAIVLGQALDSALGDRRGIARFAATYCAMDEALARAVIDLGGRAHAQIRLRLRRERLGECSCENLEHFLASFAVASRSTFHIDVLRGRNDHHKAEAAFKALALALRIAAQARGDVLASTKGILG